MRVGASGVLVGVGLCGWKRDSIEIGAIVIKIC